MDHCPMCRGKEFWVSVYGKVICEKCHPPADESIVARRIHSERPEQLAHPDQHAHRHVA